MAYSLSIHYTQRRCLLAPTITDVLTAVTALFQGRITVVLGLLLPATGTLSPLQVVMWGALIFPFIALVISLIKSLASRG